MNDAIAPAVDAPAGPVLNPEIVLASQGRPYGYEDYNRKPTPVDSQQDRSTDPMSGRKGPKGELPDLLPPFSIEDGNNPKVDATGRPVDTTDPSIKPDAQAGAPTDAPKQTEHNWWDGALSIAGDLALGAYKEVTEHPLELVEAAAVGVAIGVVSTVAAPVAIGAAVIGAGYLGYQAITHGGEIINDASVVANPEGHTKEELAKAHGDLQGLGGSATLAAAGMAGGMAGSYLTGLAMAAEESSVAASVAADDAYSTSVAADIPKVPPSIETMPPVIEPTTTPPFTIGETTMSVGNKAAWESYINTNNTPYGKAILSFTDRWGALMEKELAAGKPLDAAMVAKTADAADTEGLSGYMYGVARKLIVQVWENGPELADVLKGQV